MAKPMMFHIPQDKDLLAAIGEVALRHEHLNYALRMSIQILASIEVDEALDATTYDGASQLRDRVKRLARQRIGDGAPLLKLQALLERCKRATDKRNDHIHSVWAQALDGAMARRGSSQAWRALPSTNEMVSLAAEIMQLTGELIESNLSGFLHEALQSKLQ